MKYCINTLMFSSKLDIFEKIKISSMAGFEGIEPWINEIENENPKDIVKCMSDNKISITTITGLFGWFENDGQLMNVTDDRHAITDECKRRLELGAKINCPYAVSTTSFSHRNHFANWQQGIDRYSELIDIGKSIGCMPTLEFIGQTSQINNFFLCEKFLKDVKKESKMIIDSYHLWRGGGSTDDFKNYDPNKISVFHISDANKNIPRTQHMDRNRVMPLDGQIDLMLFARTIKKINYNGFVNIGVYNKCLWSLNPLEMATNPFKKLHEDFDQNS